MIGRTLGIYFARRFLEALVLVFVGAILLVFAQLSVTPKENSR